jgi:hypothetical protein
VVVILFFMVLVVLRRVYSSYRGLRFSLVRSLGVLVFYVAFGSFFAVTSFLEGVSLLFAGPYALALAAPAMWSYRYSDRRMSFWKGGDGQVYFRGGVVLYLIYVVGLALRLSIDLVVIGPNFLAFSTSGMLTGVALYATIATDLLLVFGLGLLVGRNVRVFRRYRLIQAGKEPLPDTPPDIQPIFGRRRELPVA